MILRLKNHTNLIQTMDETADLALSHRIQKGIHGNPDFSKKHRPLPIITRIQIPSV